MCPAVVHDFTGFITEPNKEIMKEIVDMEKKNLVGCGGFHDTDLIVIQKLIETTSEELTEDDLIEIRASDLVPDNEEEDREEAGPENKLTLYNVEERF